jgi:hypothetical protein
LSWFRHGFLPIWLRRRIIASLPRRRRLALRRAVADRLARARIVALPATEGPLPLSPPGDALALPVQQDSAAEAPQFDAVTLDFLIRGPTRDIDPLVRLSQEALDKRETPEVAEGRPEAPAPTEPVAPEKPSEQEAPAAASQAEVVEARGHSAPRGPEPIVEQVAEGRPEAPAPTEPVAPEKPSEQQAPAAASQAEVVDQLQETWAPSAPRGPEPIVEQDVPAVTEAPWARLGQNLHLICPRRRSQSARARRTKRLRHLSR